MIPLVTTPSDLSTYLTQSYVSLKLLTSGMKQLSPATPVAGSATPGAAATGGDEVQEEEETVVVYDSPGHLTWMLETDTDYNII